MPEKPNCPQCWSATDVEPMVIGARGEYGLVGYFCIDCQLMITENGARLGKYR